MKQTVELVKSEKLKKLNEKLDNMLKSKKPDTHDIDKKAQEEEEEINKIQNIQKNEKQKEQQFLQTTIAKKIQKKTKLIAKKQHKNSNSNNILRKAAGLVWEDKTMEEWAQDDYRIFCGNLGNEVSDQMLANVFRSRYSSFQKARVVRDKRTGKNRGYGFISFKHPKDFLSALKQMNGKYVGNRPVKLSKSNWQDRNLYSEKNKNLPSDFQKNMKKQTNSIFPIDMIIQLLIQMLAIQVFLNIYNFSSANECLKACGMCAYHTGVQINFLQYCFCVISTNPEISGVIVIEPESAGFDFDRKLLLGETIIRQDQFDKIITQLSEEFTNGSYHIFSNNCNHFSNEMAKRLLGQGIPDNIMRLTNILKWICCCLPQGFVSGQWALKMLQEEQQSKQTQNNNIEYH